MSTAPSAHFVRGITANLLYWSAQVAESPGNLAQEHANLLLAVQFGMRLPRTERQALLLMQQSSILIEDLGIWQEWIPLLEQWLERRKDRPPAQRVLVQILLGRWLRMSQQLEPALAYHQRAATAVQQLDDPLLHAEVCGELCADYFYLHQYERAEAAGEEALTRIQEISTAPFLSATVLNAMGLVAYARGEYVVAEERFRTAGTLWEQLALPTMQARTLRNLGLTHVRRGRYATAIQIYEQGMALLAGTEAEFDLLGTLNNLGIVYFNQGDHARAEELFREASERLQKLPGFHSLSGRLSHNRGAALHMLGDFVAAERCYRQAVSIHRQMDNPIDLARTVCDLGEALHAQRRLDEASGHYLDAIRLMEPYEDDVKAGEVLQNARRLLAELQETEIG